MVIFILQDQRYIKPMKDILVPISPGELLDKITILQIKTERMSDPGKVANVKIELNALTDVWKNSVAEDDTVKQLHRDLKMINEALWDIEDDIRDEERARNFGEKFIELARSVYVTNDQRADAKKKLNIHLGSTLVEEKSYQDYQ